MTCDMSFALFGTDTFAREALIKPSYSTDAMAAWQQNRDTQLTAHLSVESATLITMEKSRNDLQSNLETALKSKLAELKSKQTAITTRRSSGMQSIWAEFRREFRAVAAVVDEASEIEKQKAIAKLS